jgi:hypothetical protein
VNAQLAESTLELADKDLKSFRKTADLRQLLSYESVSSEYDVAGPFDYQPVKGNLEDFQWKALKTGLIFARSSKG